MSVADCLVFDIETVPDAELGRRLGFAGDDLAVAGQMLARREEETGSSFLPLEQHRVVAISTLLRSGDQLQVWSLGSVDSPEDDLVRRFHAARIAEGAELCVAASAGRTHPVIGLWSVGLRGDLRTALVEEGLRKIDRWTARFRLATVPWPAEPVDPFFNANTVEDLAEEFSL